MNLAKYHVVVGHEDFDVDCAIAMMACVAGILHNRPDARVEFAFVPKTHTFMGIEVDPRHKYETCNGKWVWHVDTGYAWLDHHSNIQSSPSSAVAVAKAFDLGNTLPEWRRLIRVATLCDQGKYPGTDTLAATIRGQQILLGEGCDIVIFRLVQRIVSGLLLRERKGIETQKVNAQKVSRLTPDGTANPSIQYQIVEGFGIVGLLVCGDRDMQGPLKSRMDWQVGCRLTISLDPTSKHIAIMSRLPSKKPEPDLPKELTPVDIVKLGIRDAVLSVEAEKWGIDGIEYNEHRLPVGISPWFSHFVEDGDGERDRRGRYANLFCGSRTANIPPGMESRISWAELVSTVLRCISEWVAS